MNGIRIDLATLITGFVYTVLGIVFLTEAIGVWTFRLTHLRLLGPVALIAVGAGFLIAVAVDARRHAAAQTTSS